MNGTQFCVYSFTTPVIYPQFLRPLIVKVYVVDANVGLSCVCTRLGSDCCSYSCNTTTEAAINTL